MSVVIETTLGDITVDLYTNDRPRACLNFLKLCKIKYYNYNLFHTISRGFIAQTGDPTGSRSGGESIYGTLDGQEKRYFEGENEPRIKHTKMGLISFVGNEERMVGSQFFLTLGEDLTYLDEKHCVFGEVVEGFDVLEMINEVICDNDDRPYQDVRITHTVILDDPFPDPKRLRVPSRSPSPTAERLKGGRIAPDEEVDELEGKAPAEIAEMQAEREAKARATILEMVGDLPDAEMAPPENVLFVCKLNPVTNDDDLEIIFSRFGKIKTCEVIRDKKTGDSLQYAFVEFEDKNACENAYFKMDNVLIDDRRIHVDFSQSVSKVKWQGKGRGVTHYDEKGRKTNKENNGDIGKGNYKYRGNEDNRSRSANGKYNRNVKEKSFTPRKDNSRYSSTSKSNTDSRRDKSPERRRRKSKTPRRIDDNKRYVSKTREDRSRTPPMRKNDSPPRRDADNSTRRRRNSESPKPKTSGSPVPKKNRNDETIGRKSRSPITNNDNRKHYEMKSVASSSRTVHDRRMTESDSDEGNGSETRRTTKKSSDRKKSKKHSPDRDGGRSTSKVSDSDSERETKKKKKKESKHLLAKNSHSGGKKKSNYGASSDSDYSEAKSKKKKSSKKSKNSSDSSDDYKKRTKKKKKSYNSDSD